MIRTDVFRTHRQAIDKMARLLELPWHDESGSLIGPGAALENLASTPISRPRVAQVPDFPISTPRQLKFSFGGPTGWATKFMDRTSEEVKRELPFKVTVARKYLDALFAQVQDKVALALKQCESRGLNITALVASGGVASNKLLRTR